MKSFLSELIKRRVFRTTGAYIGISYALLLISQSLEFALELPTWFDTAVISMLAMGLIPVIILAWAFQFSSEGLVRNRDIPKADLAALDDKVKPIDIAAIAITLFVVGVLGLRLFNPDVLSREVTLSSAGVEVPELSIAVLPFEAMSTEVSDMHLGRAIAEETLNRLAKIQELKVSARTSAFALSDSGMDIKQIGSQLGVAHVLEGSVRRSGEKIRVTAQLIRTSDGYHMWTETFEPELADLFLVEDRIVAEISRTLQIRLGVGIGAGKPTGEGIDLQAYEAYLNGLALSSLRMRNDSNRIRAYRSFQRATELDPDFAQAWAEILDVNVFSKGSPLSRDKEKYSQTIDHALERALTLDPDNVDALVSGSFWLSREKLDLQGAREFLERAHKIDPKKAEFGYASYWLFVGELERAIAIVDKMAADDPLNYGFLRARADVLSTIGRHDDAMKFYNECQADRCLREGFIPFGTNVAVMSRDEAEMATWEKHWKGFSAFVKFVPKSELPNVVTVIPAYYATEFGDPEAEQLQQEMIELFKTDPVTDTIGQWGPTFARFMPMDLFIDTLELAYERGDLFGASFDMMPFYGENNYPDELLMHPRYHALWERPGLKELEALRRANGYTHGLPLSAEDDLNE